jgi:RimJ/RimL family protein N-acetyltransferase
MTLPAPNIILRPWNIEDLGNLVLYANNIKIASFMTDQFPHPYTFEKGISFIEYANQNFPYNIMTIDLDGQAIGGIGLHVQADIQRKNAELGYWLGEPYWGMGIMTRAVLMMVEYGFQQFDIDRIYARPFGTNFASQKVLEKAGFILEARFLGTFYKYGQYADELIYAVRRF